jgi:hypothetical protein
MEMIRARTISLSSAGLALAVLIALSGASVSGGPANAVVYCKTVGVPKGCVARPLAPAAQAAVVTPVIGAPGIGLRAGARQPRRPTLILLLHDG